MSYITIEDVSRVYPKKGGDFTALDHVSLTIERGEFICLLGPSGCGKSTLLSILAGFDRPTSGSAKIDGETIEAPSIRRVTIFQNYGLLPWRTVGKNVELGLESLQLPREEREEKARRYLKLVGLESFFDHYPAELSGGMQQRVAIARALAVAPDILFMDEPFAALDAITRMKLQVRHARHRRSRRPRRPHRHHDAEPRQDQDRPPRRPPRPPRPHEPRLPPHPRPGLHRLLAKTRGQDGILHLTSRETQSYMHKRPLRGHCVSPLQ